MELEKLRYLCGIAGRLTGVPLRAYDKDERLFCCSMPPVDNDPLELSRSDVWAIEGSMGYFTSSRFFYYGVVRSGDLRIVMGPTRQVPATDQELREIALLSDVSAGRYEAFAEAMRSISPLPLNSMLQVLCCINLWLNGETRELQDIAITKSDQDTIIGAWAQNALDQARGSTPEGRRIPEDLGAAGAAGSNAYALEQLLMGMVRNGDIAGLNDWLLSAPAVRGGTLADEELRQLKNTFVVTATLTSRAAIDGGVLPEDAFALSDLCIQECERLTTPGQITNLQYRMIAEFTEKVARVRFGASPSPLTIAVGNYVQHHLSEAIKVERIAQELFMSRSRLSTRFKEETGESLSEYIMKRKVEEAKYLLRYTDHTASEIGAYLGFSSQGHFTRCFHRLCDVSPGEYRRIHKQAGRV